MYSPLNAYLYKNKGGTRLSNPCYAIIEAEKKRTKEIDKQKILTVLKILYENKYISTEEYIDCVKETDQMTDR